MIPRNYKIMVALAVVLSAAGILLAVVLYVRLDDQQNAFNQSRVDITYVACEELNGRHKNAFAKLDDLIDKLPPVRRTPARAGEAGTKELINTLAPDQDCFALVAQRFGSGARPSPLAIRTAQELKARQARQLKRAKAEKVPQHPNP